MNAFNKALMAFQSTRLSRASTGYFAIFNTDKFDFNPQGSREPRLGIPNTNTDKKEFQSTRLSRASTIFRSIHKPQQGISIHKALASLDGKNAQLFLHLCHIYMLHIIHLLQIVYQVEISSRNLIVFSGQL